MENDLRANDPENTYYNWVMANQRTAAALKAKPARECSHVALRQIPLASGVEDELHVPGTRRAGAAPAADIDEGDNRTPPMPGLNRRRFGDRVAGVLPAHRQRAHAIEASLNVLVGVKRGEIAGAQAPQNAAHLAPALLHDRCVTIHADHEPPARKHRCAQRKRLRAAPPCGSGSYWSRRRSGASWIQFR